MTIILPFTIFGISLLGARFGHAIWRDDATKANGNAIQDG